MAVADGGARTRGSFERRMWGDAFAELSAAQREDRLRIGRLMEPGVGPMGEVDAQLLGWAAARGLKVGLRNGGPAAGAFSFDAMLADLAGHSDEATARVIAKTIEYPTEQLELAGAGWPWRPTALFALTATTATTATGVALVPAAATRRNRR